MSERRFAPGPALVAALLLSAAALLSHRDLLTGSTVPAYRDIGTTQRPSRALASTLGAAKLNPAASFGQAYRGNPNLVLAYPFPAAPRWLGIQLLLHLGLGLAGAFVFLRTEVRSAEAALLGAFAWGLSGFVLSSAAFLNAATTLAWVPWLLYAVARARAAGSTRAAVRAGLLVVLAASLLVLGGEPALAALALLLAGATALRGPAPARLRGTGALLGGGLVAALLVSPWLLEVWKASVFASRRVRGFSWSEFAAVGFHPLRLLETPFPQLFGDPSRVVSGAFWGFAVTQGNPPYHASLGFGVVPLALALVFVLSARRSEARFWIATAGVALLAALTPWLPGARAAYEAVPALHVLRYPVKALLPFTLALAVLAALGADRLLVEEASRASGGAPRRCSLRSADSSRPPRSSRGSSRASSSISSCVSGTRRGPPRPPSSSRPSSRASRRRPRSRARDSPSSASCSRAGRPTRAAARSSSPRAPCPSSRTSPRRSRASRPRCSRSPRRSSRAPRSSGAASSSGPGRTSTRCGAERRGASRPAGSSTSCSRRRVRAGRSRAPSTASTTRGTRTPTAATPS